VTRDEVRKLIGGYATGSLTEAERKVLFEAALNDQELFDELAGEQILKELIESPGVRDRLVSALRPPHAERSPWWLRPWPWMGLAGAVAAAVVVLTVSLPERDQTVQIAGNTKVAEPAPAADSFATSPPSPPPVAASRAQAPVRPAAPPAKQPAAGELRTKETEAARAPEELADAAAPLPKAEVDAVSAGKGQLRAESPAPAGERGAAALEQANPARDAVSAAKAVPPPAPPAAAPEAQAQTLLRTEAAPGQQGKASPPAVGVGAGKAAAKGRAAPSQFAAELSIAGAPSGAGFGFTYAVTPVSVRIEPTARGILTITAAGEAVFPMNPVVATTPIVLPLPAGATEVTIVFAQTQDSRAVEPQRRAESSGRVTGPDGFELRVIVPVIP
jgi:hypothetical protein